MAYRQYIGARYVPLYCGDWDSTRNYEPLSIVTDGNGNSYTSIKEVAAGTALDNRDYWILTSSFSGAIQKLRSDVDGLEVMTDALAQSLADLGNTTDAITQSLADVGARVTSNTNRIDELERLGDVLVISDSYGALTNADGKTSAALLAEFSGRSVHLVSRGGGSLQQGTLLQELRGYSTQYDANIKTVIMYFGANDCGATNAAVLNGLREMVTYIRGRFTKVNRIVLAGCGLTFGETNGGVIARDRLVRVYIEGCAENNITWLGNSEYILHNTHLLQADLCHPNANGVTVLGWMLSRALISDSIDVHYKITVSASLTTKPAGAPADVKDLPEGSILQLGNAFEMRLDNGVVTISSNANLYTMLQIALGSVSSVGGRYAVLELSDTLVQHDLVESVQSFPLNGIFYIAGGDERYVSCNVLIATKTLYIAFNGAYNAAAIDNVSALTITQVSQSMPAT